MEKKIFCFFIGTMAGVAATLFLANQLPLLDNGKGVPKHLR